MSGHVALVGAGPGSPDLLTLRAVGCLAGADVVYFDRLVDPAALSHCQPHCRLINVGKQVGQDQNVVQGSILDQLVRAARAGNKVVRLKGGDPFVFGRGGEEVAVLKEAGIAYEVVPGISSVMAAPAAAGIPLTYRGLASSFGVFTVRTGQGLPAADLEAATRVDTAVLLMGAAATAQVARELRRHGKASWTPAAVITNATTAEQSVWLGTLAELEQPGLTFQSPSTIVVGPTVTVLRQALPQQVIS